jgi:hypothetical protein
MMMRRFLFALLMVVFAGGSLGAQMRRPRVYATNDPSVWFSAGIGGVRGNGVNDGVTASNWNFGDATNLQYRASVEKGMTNGSSFGVAGSYAHVPFAYTSNMATALPGSVSGTRCASCDAHLDVMTLVAVFHAGTGLGFHQVLELSGGVVAYRNLKRDSDGARLAPGGGNIDPLFSLGYGLGYGLSDRTNIDFTTDYFTYAIHERTGLSNGTSNTNSMPSLRLSLRMGFGRRTVTR